MGKQKPLEIVFLNQPSPERIFQAWAEIECTERGLRLTSLEIRRKDNEVRSA